VAFAFDRLESSAEHQQRQFGELEQRDGHDSRRRRNQDADHQSADGSPVLSSAKALNQHLNIEPRTKRRTMKIKQILSGIGLLALFSSSSVAAPLGTAFTYQGRLADGGNPATGNYDLKFTLFDTNSGGAAVAGTLTNAATAVSNGCFTVVLDFGSVFDGNERWLEIGVRTNAGGSFATLVPRQQLTAAPYAVYAPSAGAAATATTAASANSVAAANVMGTLALSQLPGAVVTNNASGVNLSGSFSGNGAGVTNVNLMTVNSQGAIDWKTLSGSFSSPSAYGAGSGAYFVTAADVNSNGKSDLISANYNANTLSVLTNNGSGGFVTASTPAVGPNPACVATADLNADGKLELICANNGTNTLLVLTNNGTAVFAVASTLMVGNGCIAVAAADINGDGKADLISADWSANTLSVLTNNGSGAFGLACSPTVGSHPRCVAAADINGDGKVELICANQSGNSLSILTNNGSAIFTVAATLAASGPYCVVAADINGDGWLDLISANNGGNSISVFKNNGSGAFGPASSTTVPTGPAAVVAVDLTGDGTIDLATVNYTAQSMSVLTNDTHGSVALSYSVTGLSTPGSIAAADVNSDGKADLICTSFLGNQLKVLTNAPTGSYQGTFAGNGSALIGLDASQLATGTLPSGRLPVAAVTNNATAVTLTGTFTGNGASLTNLSAANLTGTIADARLSANIALLNANQVFTGSNRFAGVVTLTNAANTLVGGFAGNGAGLTNLNTTNLTGTIAETRLSANVALRNATNTFTGTNVFTKPVGIDCGNPGQPLQVGNANTFGSQGMIRLASRSSSSAENRIWDIGVPQTGSDLGGAGYSFIIDDTQLGTDPEFLVHWGTGHVGIGRTNPATALDVNGTVTATGFSGNASGLTNLNASQLANGIVPNAQLSTSVSLLGQSIESGEITDGTIAAADVNAASFNTTFWRTAGNAGTTPGTHFVGTTDNQALELRVNNVRALRLQPGGFGNSPNVIGGYSGNSVRASDYGSTIGGGGDSDAGYSQTISAYYATIAGGAGNTIGTNAGFSSIGGGLQNTMAASALEATIGGGYTNYIGYNCNHAVIGGGYLNKIGDYSYDTTIGGGVGNEMGTDSDNSVISGGYHNSIANNGSYATIPGGRSCYVTSYAFASGNRAKANHTGAFVWGDSYDADIASTNANSVTMRASGGYRLFSNSGATAGAYLAPGGGSWTSMSDRNAKEDFRTVNAQEVLKKVTALPLTTWKYKSQDVSVRHIGPVAQDFKAAFGVGETDTGITSIDADGVALAAIQGLNQKLEAQRVENVKLKKQLDQLQALVATLSAKLDGGAK